MTPSTRLLARLLPLVLPFTPSCGGSTANPSTGDATQGVGGSTSQGGSSSGAGGASAGTSSQGGSSVAGSSAQGGTGVAGTSAQGGSGVAGTSAQGGSAVGGSGAQGGNGVAGTSAQGGSAVGGSGAQGGSGVAGTSSQGGSGQGGSGIPCADTPLLPDADTGYLVCGPNGVHRTSVVACPNHLPMMNGACDNPNGPPGSCGSDSACTMSPYGYCAPNSGGGALICGCHYGCVADSDCTSGQICLCDTDIGSCVTAHCTTDADCNGGLCLSYAVPQSCTTATEFACTTPQDQCISDSDCPQQMGQLPMICSHDGQKRVCVAGPGLCAGRPMIVEQGARVAELTRGAAWSMR